MNEGWKRASGQRNLSLPMVMTWPSGMADSAQMESTSKEKQEILRKFKIAKQTSLGHSDSTEIKRTRVRTRVQITSNKNKQLYYFENPQIPTREGKHLYLTILYLTPGNTNVRDRYLSFTPWDVRSVLILYQCLPS